MEVDSAASNHVDESKGQSLKQAASKASESRPPASEMTSADYYFDSYAHFGKYHLLLVFSVVARDNVLTVHYF